MGEVLGIDVSHHNGVIDWAKVAASGKKFAIIKCQYEAQSHRKDERFEYNYAEAGKFGLSRGVYIYIASASISDPKKDAESLINNLHGRNLEYGIWLDLEDRSLEAKGKGFIRDLVYFYTGIFAQAGYYVGIYCNKDWYSRLIHEDLKRDFDFWIARYPRNDTGVYDATSSLKPSNSIAVAWQYSSKGRVDGINTNVDLNVDYDGIIKLYASAHEKCKTITPELIRDIIGGKYGNGEARKAKLINLGYNYEEVRAKINELDAISKSITAAIKTKAGEYWESVVKMIAL